MKIRSFPTERQLDTKDCGATCIKIIREYYWKFYSLQYLRDKAGTTCAASWPRNGVVTFIRISRTISESNPTPFSNE